MKHSNCVDTISLVEEVDRQTKVLHIEQCHILLFNIKESELHKIEKNFNDYFEINVNDKINQEYINSRKLRRYKTKLNNAVLQSTAYYPSGAPLTLNDFAPQTIKLHTGKDLFDLQGAGWYDNHARYYDCLLGRFTSQDPLAEKYPGLNPYNHCANNPLKFIDPDGQKVRINNYYNNAVSNYAQIAATQMGNNMLSYLENQVETYSLNSTFLRSSSSYNPQNRTISYVGSPWFKKVPYDGGYLNSMVAMGHELFHAYDHASGLFNKDNVNKNYLEPRAVSFGNYLRQAFSLQPLREKYSNIKGDFHQNFGNDKITNLINLDSGNNKYGYSFDRTQYNYVVESNGLPRLINTDTTKFYMIINIDDNNNITHQIYNSKSEYEKNW